MYVCVCVYILCVYILCVYVCVYVRDVSFTDFFGIPNF